MTIFCRACSRTFTFATRLAIIRPIVNRIDEQTSLDSRTVSLLRNLRLLIATSIAFITHRNVASSVSDFLTSL
jgi:hypothetical protein